MDSLWKALENLSPEEKLKLSGLLAQQPELMQYFEKSFYEKLATVKNNDKNRLEEIYKEEKDTAVKILNELIANTAI